MLVLPIFTVSMQLSFRREKACRWHVLAEHDSLQRKTPRHYEKASRKSGGLRWRYLFTQLACNYRFGAEKHAGGMF